MVLSGILSSAGLGLLYLFGLVAVLASHPQRSWHAHPIAIPITLAILLGYGLLAGWIVHRRYPSHPDTAHWAYPAPPAVPGNERPDSRGSQRTTTVSSRTPSATANPSSVRMVNGSVASDPNVPASASPADVITPPVAASAVTVADLVPDLAVSSRTRSSGRCCVDAQSDQEHENEQRK